MSAFEWWIHTAQEDEGFEEDPDVKGGGRSAEDRRRNIKQVRCHPPSNWAIWTATLQA